MWLSRYFVYFMVFSFLGWVYETLFCTVKAGKWQNRGFLYGPVCPIYGVGAVAITALMDFVQTYVWWQVFLAAFLGSMVLEYVTSWGLEKLFHAYWWDYSEVPLNLNGRICLPATIGFGLAGLLIVYGIAPWVKGLASLVSPIWLECFGLVFMGLLSADFTLTVSALTNFDRNVEAMENMLNQHMDQFVSTMRERAQNAGQTVGYQRAERIRFAQEHAEHTIRSMGSLYRSTVGRVKGFRGTGAERSGQMKNILRKGTKDIRRIPELLRQHQEELERKSKDR